MPSTAQELFEGDTVYSRSEVLEKRESKSRPNAGIIRVKTIGFKLVPGTSRTISRFRWMTLTNRN